jgi:hypothetical protein
VVMTIVMATAMPNSPGTSRRDRITVRLKRAANSTNGATAAQEIRPAQSFKRDGVAAADGRNEIGSRMAIR